jgi:hypothetical protein
MCARVFSFIFLKSFAISAPPPHFYWFSSNFVHLVAVPLHAFTQQLGAARRKANAANAAAAAAAAAAEGAAFAAAEAEGPAVAAGSRFERRQLEP